MKEETLILEIISEVDGEKSIGTLQVFNELEKIICAYTSFPRS